MHRWRRCDHIHQTAILVALILTPVNLTVEGAGASDEGWALLYFKSAVSDDRGVLGVWRAEDTPRRCEWYGVSCDKDFHISTVNLRNSGLSGTISPELHRLRKLRTLILSENSFSGPIPEQLSKIGKKGRFLNRVCWFLWNVYCATLWNAVCFFHIVH